jgi:hypothetical protein
MAPKKSGKITRLEPEGVELLEAYPKFHKSSEMQGGLTSVQHSRVIMNNFFDVCTELRWICNSGG